MVDHSALKLTDVQQQAADWKEGALLVLAGPGAGKTAVLTTRIARLLRSDESFKVLALTFTRKAADEMRERIAGLSPGPVSRASVTTFHGFCTDVLRAHGSHVGVRPDFVVYAGREDLDAILIEGLKNSYTAGLVPEEGDSSLVPLIERLQSDLTSPEASPDVVASTRLRSRIRQIYEAFEAALDARNALSFGSMLYRTVTLFRRFETLARRYQETYKYWHVDEFQDTSKAQFELILAMATGGFRNIFAVADDDQIIYQWNGASHQRIEEFRAQFSPELIQLPTNFRCPPDVVRLGNLLIRNNTRRIPGKAVGVSGRTDGGSGSVRVAAFADDVQEAAGIVDDIRTRSLKLEDVVVLGRSRKQLEGVHRAAMARGVRASLLQRRERFESPAFGWLEAVLKLAFSRRNRRLVEIVSSSFSALSGVDVDPATAIALAESRDGDFLRSWLELATGSGLAVSRGITDCAVEWLVNRPSYSRFVEDVVPRLGQFPPDERYEEDAKAWTEIWRETQKSIGDAPLEIFLQELDLRSKQPVPSKETLILMTVHSAKGKEFPHVYVMGLAEGEFPTFQAAKMGADSVELEEERRNCFVALTRSLSSVTLTYAHSYWGWQKLPSRFLAEMGLRF